MDNIKFGKYLSKMRKDNHMTQAELANKLNVTYQAVSRWENGNNLPDINTMEEIAKIFNIDISDVIKSQETSEVKKKKIINKKYLIIILICICVGIVLIVSNIKNNNVPDRFIHAIKQVYKDNENFIIEDYKRNDVTDEFKEAFYDYYIKKDYEYIYKSSIGKYIFIEILGNSK